MHPLTAGELHVFMDHQLRLRQIQIAEARIHAHLATASAIYNSSTMPTAGSVYSQQLRSLLHLRGD